MDTRTGEILTPEEVKALRKSHPEMFGPDQNDKLRAELTALQARLAGARKVSVCRGGGSTVPESSVFIDNCCIDSPIEAFCKCGVDLQPGREQTVFVLPAEEGEVTT